MTPTHSEGMAAAKRVQAANAEGQMADARDAICMMSYNLSMYLRLLPEDDRLAEAERLGALLIANTKESLG